jgi:hypothetical protein
MTSPQRPVLFLNPRSGGDKAERAGLAERARTRHYVVALPPDQSLAALVEEAVAQGADVLGIAGGDGSLAIVASAALAHDLPFICVAAGTRNHFALDLGVERNDLVASLEAFTDGVERRIDVAEVNGRLFLTSSTTSPSGSTATRFTSCPTATPRRARSWRRLRTCSGRVPQQSTCSWRTTAANRTGIPPSCSCRTTPTRSNRRMHPAPGRGSTAGNSGSSSSTKRAPGSLRD